MDVLLIIRFEHAETAVQGVPRKRCSENMQQIYKRTPMSKCDFNKVSEIFNDGGRHQRVEQLY